MAETMAETLEYEAARCTTHHYACDCRELMHARRLEAMQTENTHLHERLAEARQGVLSALVWLDEAIAEWHARGMDARDLQVARAALRQPWTDHTPAEGTASH